MPDDSVSTINPAVALERRLTAGNDLRAHTLSHSLGQLTRLLHITTLRMAFAEMKGEGLFPGGYAALTFIGENPGVQQNMLVVALSLREPNINAIVKKLQANKLIERRKSMRDRRAFGLWLTDHGREVLARTMGLNETLERDVWMADLSDEECETLKSLMQRVLLRTLG